jgi:hypothetical protein
VQIGIHGSVREPRAHDWVTAQGKGNIEMEDFARRGQVDVMAAACEIVGQRDTYIIFERIRLIPR